MLGHALTAGVERAGSEEALNMYTFLTEGGKRECERKREGTGRGRGERKREGEGGRHDGRVCNFGQRMRRGGFLPHPTDLVLQISLCVTAEGK